MKEKIVYLDDYRREKGNTDNGEEKKVLVGQVGMVDQLIDWDGMCLGKAYNGDWDENI